MTPLTTAVLALLDAEVGMPPLQAASIARILWITGTGQTPEPATPEQIKIAADELIREGRIERVWRKGTVHYRVIKSGERVAAAEPDAKPQAADHARERAGKQRTDNYRDDQVAQAGKECRPVALWLFGNLVPPQNLRHLTDRVMKIEPTLARKQRVQDPMETED